MNKLLLAAGLLGIEGFLLYTNNQKQKGGIPMKMLKK